MASMRWHWEGGATYSKNLGGGGEASLGTAYLAGSETPVAGVMMAWHHHTDGSFSLMLGDYPHEVTIGLRSRMKETAEREAEPYVRGFMIGKAAR